jgi:hypothetical protein
MLLPVLSFLLLSAFLAACGGQAAPTAPAEGTRPATVLATAIPTRPPQPTPIPTQPPQPTPLPTEPALPTPGAVPDLSAALEHIKALPGYHFEGFVKGQVSGESPSYLRYVQDVDTAANSHLMAYEEEGAPPTLDLYYIQKHLYILGSEGTYIDLGVQEEDQAATFYQAYLLPFTAVFLGASDLEAVGQETVNGLLTTRYRANFNRWVQTYLQVQADVSYAADGYVWFSEQYGVIVKSQVHVSWSAEGQKGEYEAQTEISQVGQIPPIALPQ